LANVSSALLRASSAACCMNGLGFVPG
jgi:hypothetical protein